MPSRFQWSASSTPSRPRIFIRVRLPLTSKPVPNTIVSTACSVPSAVTTPCGVTRAIGVGDDVDVVRVSAG